MGKLCTGGYAALLIGMLSSYMKLLESSWNQLWSLRLGEERSWRIQTWWELLSDFLLVFQSSVPGPQSISQRMCGLHAKMIKSTASLPPSEGVISWVFFFFFFFLSHPGKRALMDGDFYFKGLFSFLGRSDILVTHPNSSCRGKSAKG